MGLFSKLRNIGRNIADPGHLVFKDKSSGATTAAAPAASDPAMADPNTGMYGDSTDPQYGSLLQPFDVEQFYNYADPGYAFELQQGTQAVRNAAAAGSGALSGAALKDLIGYSQNFARTGYNDAFNRYQVQQGNIFQRLSDIARLGQSAAAGVGSAGTQLATGAGQSLTTAGGAAGAGIVGAGNALGQGVSDYWLWKNYGGIGGGAVGTGAGVQAGNYGYGAPTIGTPA